MNAQLAEAQRQVRHLQRLAAVGTSAVELAHECNNLLTPIFCYARYALDCSDAELKDKALATALRQCEVLQGMSSRILSFASRNSAGAMTPVNVGNVVAQALGCLGCNLEKHGISVRVDMPRDLCVLGNVKELQQVFLNLLLNARHAMRGRTGRLMVCGAPLDDRRVRLSVADTGEGIPPEHLDRIFEPFFTTRQTASKSAECGTGLGLTLCREIVQEHHGTIAVQSKVGEGSTFTLELPRA